MADGPGHTLSLTTEAAGYAHAAYAASLSEFGMPRLLPRSGGWILERTPREGFRDAMGCYPLFSCEDWAQLGGDLDELRGQLVSVVVVTDPFGAYDAELLERAFGDVVRPYKRHFVTDLRASPESFVDPHHRRYARAALARVETERCEAPTRFLDDWTELYGALIQRHRIRSMAAFSRSAFERQFAVPGVVAFRASAHGETAAMAVWYVQGDVAYYHLGASSVAGYEVRASFALFWRALEHFAAARIGWLDLGAAAGAYDDPGDGLSRFKRGWATGTRTAYLCGSILDAAGYAALGAARREGSTSYFPAYRDGEFS